MKVLDIVKEATSFGAAVKGVREHYKLSREDFAGLVKLHKKMVRDIEYGLAHGEPSLPAKIKNVFRLTDAECDWLEEQRARGLRLAQAVMRGDCPQCEAENACSMHVGEGSRHEECRHIAACVGKIVRSFPSARACHCPPQCAAKSLMTREERLLEATAYGVEGDALPDTNYDTRRKPPKERETRKINKRRIVRRAA